MDKSPLPQLNSYELSNILREMNVQGNYPLSVISDMDGFLVATATQNEGSPTMQAAVVAMIQRAVTQAQSHVKMSQAVEVIVNDQDGKRLVCRAFAVNGDVLILTIVIPNQRQPYRRLINQTLATIQSKWQPT